MIDPEKLKYVHMGREAFENGLPRIPPTTDQKQAMLWLYGYDIAELTARTDFLKPVTIDLPDSIPGTVIEPLEVPEREIPEDFTPDLTSDVK